MAKKRVKAKSVKPPASDNGHSLTSPMKSELIAVALSSVNVLMKVCRLCETKDGPFLNIFDADQVTAKKIEEILPFGVRETDGLPHKICFRCSAKVEELYEFIQKCINTQKNLHSKLGKKEPVSTKPKARELWEAKLNKSNISNDDLCDAVIKKAMANIKDIPNIPILMDEELGKKSNSKAFDAKKPKLSADIKTEHIISSDSSVKEIQSDSSISKVTIKPNVEIKKRIENAPSESSSDMEEVPLRPTRKAAKRVMPESDSESDTDYFAKKTKQISQKSTEQTISKPLQSSAKSDVNQRTDQLSFDYVEKEKPAEKPFNIMDHISMIKVNDVGVLFQCKLCNRNFLKREVVEVHGCSKNGIPKVDFTHSIARPDPPKITTVKYINTKDIDLKKSSMAPKMPPAKVVDIEIKKEPQETPKPKPRIGPASRVRRDSSNNTIPRVGMVITPKESTPPPAKQTKQAKSHEQEPLTSAPSIQIPSIPSLNSRYKLVPGPNNTFSLVEDKNQESASILSTPTINENSGKNRKPHDRTSKSESNKSIIVPTDIIDLDESSTSQPYPVGLFQTVAPNSKSHSQTHTASTVPAAFTTPAMKKQSYTIVQTGNPSKLLISTKPQTVDELSKKRSKKSKKHDLEPTPKQPFTVTVEDNKQPKDPYFTFINVDPVLQPSYVLPIDSSIQEAQITTSSSAVKLNLGIDNDKYSCNMCAEKFSREKKLLAHIQSHYNKLDAEDQERANKNSRKRSKKS